jgi:hypothetical protein
VYGTPVRRYPDHRDSEEVICETANGKIKENTHSDAAFQQVVVGKRLPSPEFLSLDDAKR